jgi:hypothetical protein
MRHIWAPCRGQTLLVLPMSGDPRFRNRVPTDLEGCYELLPSYDSNKELGFKFVPTSPMYVVKN